MAAWVLFAPLLAENLIVEKPLARADAIFVLGGSSAYLERTEHAAALYKQAVAPKIILTDDGTRGGWSKIEQRNPPFVELARKNLIVQGVPAESIEIIKPSGSGTIYEAECLRQKVEEDNLKSVLLVTSAYHTRRTLRTFERLSADENISLGVESAPFGWQTPPPRTWWFSQRGWNAVAGEYVKSVYYWVYY